MTLKELGDDAQSDIEAFVTYTNLTTSNIVRAISEAFHEMQKRTLVLEKTITVDASTLDMNGSIALDKSITVPRRGTYVIPGSAISAPCRLKFISRDSMAEKKLNYQWSQILPSNVIYCCIEQSRLYFFPYQNLTGTFTLSCVAKMPVYSTSEAANATSFWYNWIDSNIGGNTGLYATTDVPQEFEGGLTGLTAYVSARLLTFIPGWQRRFAEQYRGFLERFESEVENIRENLPDYELNYEPWANWGGAY